MKVYYVYMPYYDGDHEHGYYKSPLFLKKEDAEEFKQMLIDIFDSDPNDDRSWWTDDGSWFGAGPKIARIEEIEIVEEVQDWDNFLKPAKEYLYVTWT